MTISSQNDVSKGLCNTNKIMYNRLMIPFILLWELAVPADETELKLIQSVKEGDQSALEALILRYEKIVYNVAYRFMGNEADAYDMAQEALIKIYRSAPKFRLESSFSSWVYRVTANACMDGLRKRKKTPISLDSTLENGAVFEDTVTMTPENHVLSIESRDDIQKAISALSQDHRIAVVLRDVQGLSYEEIAGILGISIGTVKSRLSRGRQRLKEMLMHH